jgi:aminoglycoside 6'-N-acetyltransferase
LSGGPPTLEGARLRLRPVGPDDRSRLREILAEPSVARWWTPGSPDHVVDEWLEPDEDTTCLVIEVDGRVVGSLQFFEESGDDYRYASIDLFLDTAHQDQGLGSEAIRAVARHLFEERGHHRLTIDPAAANLRAIRAYERVGFRRVGTMRSYERGPDGAWHDNLLMDLLLGELR